MPPVQEISETIEVQNQAPNPPTHTPAFPRGLSSVNGEGNVYGETDVDSSKIPSTAEQCKEFINRSKQQSIPLLNNNNSNIKNYNDEEDDDDCWNLTSLDWLQDRNLLRKVITNPDSSRAGGFFSASPTPSDEGKCNSSCKYIIPKRECLSDSEGFEPLMPEAYHPTRHADCKPPYSYSCLIFMAIENSSEKKLPVKEIYAWIQNNFPFYKRAPSGWMNSVRHNLSLNKCFTKVEKDKGVGIGKGSYWCVDPTYKANLLHALRKTPYQPFHQMQMVSTNHASASFGTPLSSQDGKQNQSLKSLFPYVSKKTQGKHTADSSEIDVANALVSLRKSGTTLNKARCKQHSAGVGDEEFDEEDSDWVDEDVDDDEADDDDEEITTAEMVHMLKQKLGQEKVKKNFSCTPAVSIDHQYGMTDDRVRDILTRFDCFDEYCSLSSMSEDEDSDEGLQPKRTPTSATNLLADVEIKQEIKEEPLSEDERRDDAQQKASAKQSGLNVTGKKSLKFGFGKKTRFVSIIKKAAMTASNDKAGLGIKRKRKSSNYNARDGEPPNKRASKDFDEEEQRVREGADALLELATNTIAGRSNEDFNVKDASKQEKLKEPMSSQSDETNKKSSKRGRPPAKRNPRQKSSRNKDISSDEVTNESGSTRRVDGKKRLPKDFVPNGLTSVSSTPRSFQSKRLQMRYLEQIVTSNETATAEQTAKAAKISRTSTRNKNASRRSNGSAQENPDGAQNARDLEELDSKNWTLNFSSIDLSEVNSVELATGDMLFNEHGNEMVVLVKEEPVDELKIKEEVVDGDEGYSY